MRDPSQAPLADSHGRKVNYLRLSVTDRCNLRCIYCAPENPQFIPHDDVLRYEEMAKLISMSRRLGVEKVRLTGGEPLVRKGFTDFVRTVLDLDPELDLRITTNGTLLPRHAEELYAAGIRNVNVSLDTLDRDAFSRITGRDLLPSVLEGIDLCMDLGMRVKINAVAMPTLNREQMPAFLEYIRKRPIDLRFIERMPVGSADRMGREPLWPAADILAEAARFVELSPVSVSRPTSGPARIHTIAGHAGRLGIIAAVSQHFCKTCNRLRITSDGNLRTCLYSDKQYRLRGILRHEKLGLDQAVKVMRLAGAAKPQGHLLLAAREGEEAVCRTAMHSIGG